MKTFAEYLVEAKQTFSCRLKIAGDLPDNFVENLKKQLSKFDLVGVSEVKTTPIQSAIPDFPQFGNEPMSYMDIELNYPATPPELTEIAMDLGLDPNRVMIQGIDYADSIDAEREAQKNSKNLMKSPYPKSSKRQQELKKDYSADPSKHQVVLKNTYHSDFRIAGGKTPVADTTNNYPMGNVSAVGSKRNQLPTVKSAAR